MSPFNEYSDWMNPPPLPHAICTRLKATPNLLALAASNPTRYPALLESLGRPTIAGSLADEVSLLSIALSATSDSLLPFSQAKDSDSSKQNSWDLLLIADPSAPAIVATHNEHNFLARLSAAQLALSPLANNDAGVPFVGGYLVYLGFEVANDIEPRLKLSAPAFEFPKAIAIRCMGAFAINRQTQQAFLLLEPEAQDQRSTLLADAARVRQAIRPKHLALELFEDAPAQFTDGVARVQQYLLAGDVFQVNLSRAYRADLHGNPSSAQLYANLRAANPSPFSGLLQWQESAVISSSPERLVSVINGRVQTRPIAGTKPRVLNEPELSEAEKAQFIGDKKERAEHIMLIDLERNDLGRVCKPGTVEVNELLSVESYAHVHHLVSNVRGELCEGVDAIDVLRAVFPGGTITGCPKVRCMEIISELEATGRGPYTGSMGYLSRDGQMDFNILIRTFAKCRNAAGQIELHFRAGAGIVVDSIADKELVKRVRKPKVCCALCLSRSWKNQSAKE
jgi:anthranilate synthase component I